MILSILKIKTSSSLYCTYPKYPYLLTVINVIKKCNLYSSCIIFDVQSKKFTLNVKTSKCKNLYVHIVSFYNCNFYVFLDTSKISIFVLDEADEMLSRGFKDQIYDVFRTLSEKIQVKHCC